jgi:hypothetical protein
MAEMVECLPGKCEALTSKLQYHQKANEQTKNKGNTGAQPRTLPL